MPQDLRDDELLELVDPKYRPGASKPRMTDVLLVLLVLMVIVLTTYLLTNSTLVLLGVGITLLVIGLIGILTTREHNPPTEL